MRTNVTITDQSISDVVTTNPIGTKATSWSLLEGRSKGNPEADVRDARKERQVRQIKKSWANSLAFI